MRWPWVSRAECEQWKQSSHAWHRSFEGAQGAIRRWEEKYDALVRDLMAMKKEGFQIVHPPAPRERQEPTASDEAINERSGRNPGLRRHLIGWRNQQRNLGMTEDDLAKRILNWDTGEGEE